MKLEFVKEDICTLSDNQLKDVAGGTTILCVVVIVLVIIDASCGEPPHGEPQHNPNNPK